MQKKIEVYFTKESIDYEWDILQKGFHSNIVVVISNKKYLVNTIVPERLMSEYKYSIQENGFYDIEENLILLDEVSKEEIIFTIEKLFLKSDFFFRIKPEIDDSIDLSKMVKVFEKEYDD